MSPTAACAVEWQGGGVDDKFRDVLERDLSWDEGHLERRSAVDRKA